MKFLLNNKIWFCILGIAMTLSFASCEEDDNSPEPDEESETAYLYSGRYSTPDGRKFLMGAFSAIPDSDPDISKLTELTGTSVATFVYNGAVYSWDGEASEMTKWAVGEDLSLTKLDLLSFTNTGITGNNFGAAFFSDTEAYLPAVRLGVIVQWNPTDMTITESITVPKPNTTYEAWNWRTYVSGDNLIIPFELLDYDNLTAENKTVVGIFDTKSKSIKFAEDSRVRANDKMFPDENGDLYSYPSGSPTFMEYYGPEKTYPKVGGMVRIKNGESEFDAGFYKNVLDDTEGSVSLGMFYVGNSKWLVKQYADQSEYPAKEDLWDFWRQELDFKLYDHSTGKSVDFPGKPIGYSGNNGWFKVDGQHYHQNPNRETGNTEIVVISETGWQKVFEIKGGDLNNFAKIR